MLKTYQYRIYPTKEQRNKLELNLELARFAYNNQLALIISTYKEKGKNLTTFELNNSLIFLKKEYPVFKNMHSQVIQEINKRIVNSFRQFFNRIKRREKPGFPRFKNKNRYRSITYPQSGFSLNNNLYISKIGNISIIKHRNIEGKIKTMTIKKSSTNKWHVYFSVEHEIKKMPIQNNKSIGLDLGLHHFYADSEGNTIDNPRWFRRSEIKLASLQRNYSRKKKGSMNRKKLRLKIARLHEKISNQRKDFLHKQSRKLASSYSFIAVEKLLIKNMQQNRYLSKSINDAGWYTFQQMLAYKVEETGGKLFEIDAKGTSQSCICGNKVEKSLNIRIHKCNRCGVKIDRDVMSAMVIKQIALKSATAGSAGSNAWGDERMLSSMSQELLLPII